MNWIQEFAIKQISMKNTHKTMW